MAPAYLGAMGGKRTWTDDQLRVAIANQRSWRGVLKSLGLSSTSSIGVAQRRAVKLGLDTSHFTGPRRWSNRQLIDAVAKSRSWKEIAGHLGLVEDRRTGMRLKGHAIRLGLDVTHLQEPLELRPSIDHMTGDLKLTELRRAAPTLAAAWFALRGLPVAMPSEPQAYDLLVTAGTRIQRVQVKTTTNVRDGSWQVGIGHRPYSLDKSASKAPYDPESLDFFFIVNGVGELYLIPIEVLAGLTNIYLDSYADYRVGDASSLFG